MSELGNRLKQAREERNLSLEDLQDLTKIQKRYLVGIEEGNYEMMPGKFYVRAFIKQYAEAVGLDSELLFEEYKNDVPSTYNDDLPERLSRVKTQKELPKSASKALELLPKLLIIACIIAIAVIVWIWRQNGAETDGALHTESTVEDTGNVYETAEGATKSENGQDEEENSLVESEENTTETEEETALEEVPAQTISVKETQAKTTTYELTGTDKFELEVVAKGNTWVSIKNGTGKAFFGAEIKEGESEINDFTAESEIQLRIGNVPGTEIKINGEVLKYEINPSDETIQNINILNTQE
ncbi:helix-turn-helix domain-containing protein [Metabacillus herbersteinensis]|uniref:Helix-turn-helix domain-containing protein n=1 Tax=Metabacillus herbersteinensis TaxID=283816 RepID=A0ABV6GDA3_9BACI